MSDKKTEQLSLDHLAKERDEAVRQAKWLAQCAWANASSPRHARRDQRDADAMWLKARALNAALEKAASAPNA